MHVQNILMCTAVAVVVFAGTHMYYSHSPALSVFQYPKAAKFKMNSTAEKIGMNKKKIQNKSNLYKTRTIVLFVISIFSFLILQQTKEIGIQAMVSIRPLYRPWNPTSMHTLKTHIKHTLYVLINKKLRRRK